MISFALLIYKLSCSFRMSGTNEDIPTIEVLFGVLSILCFLVGTPSSLFCLLFFSGKPRKTINIIMFILISFVDMITCILVFFVGLSAFGVHFFFDNSAFCNAWGVIWSVVIKLSIVMIAVLSVTRTVSILYPLSKVKVSVFLGVVSGYLLLFLVHSTVPYWFGVQYSYYKRTARCTWDDIDVYGWGAGKSVEYFLTPILTFLVPTLTVIVCFCVLMCKLFCRAHQQVQHNSTNRPAPGNTVGGRRPRVSVISVASTISMRGDAKVHSTITVLILTIFYICLTVPSTVMRLIGYTHELHHKEAYNLTVSYEVYRLVTTYFLPINSVCNTIVYFVRIRDLREYTCRMLCRILVPHSISHSTTSRIIRNSIALSSTNISAERRISSERRACMEQRVSITIPCQRKSLNERRKATVSPPVLAKSCPQLDLEVIVNPSNVQ